MPRTSIQVMRPIREFLLHALISEDRLSRKLTTKRRAAMSPTETADEVHLHIPAGFRGTIHVHIDGGSCNLAASESIMTAKEDPAFVAMLTRFERYNPSDPSATDVASMFLSCGYKPLLPQAWASATSDSSYIRWVYAGSSKTVTLYQNSVAISSYAQDQSTVAANLKGGTEKKSGWYFYLTLGPDALKAVLKAFTTYANGIA
jgi:hypothetical protein